VTNHLNCSTSVSAVANFPQLTTGFSLSGFNFSVSHQPFSLPVDFNIPGPKLRVEAVALWKMGNTVIYLEDYDIYGTPHNGHTAQKPNHPHTYTLGFSPEWGTTYYGKNRTCTPWW
jgi:hypothetical protein